MKCFKNRYKPSYFRGSVKHLISLQTINSYQEYFRYEIWCSTEHSNKRLDAAWREREGKVTGPLNM